MHLVGAFILIVWKKIEISRLLRPKLRRMTDDDNTARAPYSTYNTFKITGKIFLATKNLPTINGTDNGIYRRFQIIPFERIFTADLQDRGLQKRLEGELPGILNGLYEVVLNGSRGVWTTLQSSGAAEPLQAGHGYGGQV